MLARRRADQRLTLHEGPAAERVAGMEQSFCSRLGVVADDATSGLHANAVLIGRLAGIVEFLLLVEESRAGNPDSVRARARELHQELMATVDDLAHAESGRRASEEAD
jgi:hypothetical protein